MCQKCCHQEAEPWSDSYGMHGSVTILRSHPEFEVTGDAGEKFVPMKQLTQITEKSWLDGAMVIWNASARQESGPWYSRSHDGT